MTAFIIGTFFVLLGLGIAMRQRKKKMPPKGPSKVVDVYKGEGVPFP
jgi:hypothetical protein